MSATKVMKKRGHEFVKNREEYVGGFERGNAKGK